MARLHWIGPSDAPPVACILARAFAADRRIDRWRFLVKVLTTPHLTDGDRQAVVGVSILAKGARPLRRVRFAAQWALVGWGRPATARRPMSLLTEGSTTWHGMNLAAVPGTRPIISIQLARSVERMADSYGIVVVIEAAPNQRLRDVYARHGFVPESDHTSMLVRTPRQRASPKWSPRRRPRIPLPTVPWTRVFRTGRVTSETHRRTFGAPPAHAGVLDVGAGDSPLAHQLGTKGHLAVALDPQYRDRRPDAPSAVAALASALPIAGETFNEVLESFVLMHVDDRETALRESARVLRPGGRICICPVWLHGWEGELLRSDASVTIHPGRLLPRQRPSLEVRVDEYGLDDRLLQAVAKVTAPPAPLLSTARLVMRMTTARRGSTQIDTRRPFRRPSRGVQIRKSRSGER